jgi:hypothetical protein
MFKFLGIYFILISGLSIAQTTYFKSIGGGFTAPANYLTVDSINNKLYAYGSFSKIKSTNLLVKGAAIWDGIQWDSIRHIVGDSIGQVVNIDNVLYGIGYQIVKQNPITHVWEVIARPNKSPFVSFNRLAKFGNDLIIFGNQDSINGVKVSQIVKYDGVNFTSLGNTNFSGNFFMQEYQGELYIGGGFTESNYGLDNLAKWNGSTWINIPWASGCSFCNIGKLIVYQNKLFIGGHFSKSTGQAGDNLLSWDGVNLVDYNLIGNSVESVWDMCIYKNKLIITGFMDAQIPLSSQQFTGFLSYDGIDMCSYAPYYNNSQSYRLTKADVFQDTLVFLSNRAISPTDTVNFITKYVGDFIPLYCSNGVGVKENYYSDVSFKIYPNPATSIINIVDEFSQLQSATIQIKNYLGQIVFSSPFANQINLSVLSTGMYFLTLLEDHNSHTVKFVKQ